MIDLTLEEIINIFNKRELNRKCNNWLVTELDSTSKLALIGSIESEITIKTLDDNSFDTDYVVMNNVLVDLKKIQVRDLLSYLLECLNIPSSMDFKDKFALLRYRGLLRDYNKCSSIILYNGEHLMNSDRMLLNEIYGFNTSFFNVNDLTTEEALSTFQTSSGLVLDSRDDYTRVRLLK